MNHPQNNGNKKTVKENPAFNWIIKLQNQDLKREKK